MWSVCTPNGLLIKRFTSQQEACDFADELGAPTLVTEQGGSPTRLSDRMDSCFNQERLFIHKGTIYERMKVDEHNPHEFRCVLSYDDYDYVESFELISELRGAANSQGIAY